jgi:RecQ family ATP-dependent DNA helicase
MSMLRCARLDKWVSNQSETNQRAEEPIAARVSIARNEKPSATRVSSLIPCDPVVTYVVPYEQKRLETIAKNRQVLMGLGLPCIEPVVRDDAQEPQEQRKPRKPRERKKGLVVPEKERKFALPKRAKHVTLAIRKNRKRPKKVQKHFRSFLRIDSLVEPYRAAGVPISLSRKGQSNVYKLCVSGDSVLYIAPTGFGKTSVCHALAAAEGRVVVVCPLKSLMANHLADCPGGLEAGCMHSGNSMNQNVLKSFAAGHLSLLMVSPELFVQPWLHDALCTIGVKFVCVDEAHCVVSDHQFRPSYLMLRERIKKLGAVTLALTATASDCTSDEICRTLGIEHVVRVQQERTNLQFYVREVDPENKAEELFNILEGNDDANVIIYVNTRRRCDDVVNKLNSGRWTARSFHAGVDQADRTRSMHAFMNGKLKIIVATLAFGMGINKPDVGIVVHYDIPRSVSDYWQQVGRAGRDGRVSKCICFVDPQAFYELYKKIHRNSIDPTCVEQIVSELQTPKFKSTTEANGKMRCLRSDAMEGRFHVSEETLHMILLVLEEQGALVFDGTGYSGFKKRGSKWHSLLKMSSCEGGVHLALHKVLEQSTSVEVRDRANVLRHPRRRRAPSDRCRGKIDCHRKKISSKLDRRF